MLNILLVDDNENNRLTLELLLEEIEEIEINEAINGQEAVHMCENKFYDLIFMDIMMPVMDGIEATILIKSISKTSMIIALSALDDKESKQRMLLVGAEDYLTKPVDGDLFLQRVRNYINIIKIRKNDLLNDKAINPFTSAVYDRKVVFYIKNEESIVQLWDFFLQSGLFPCKDFSDYIRVIYAFSKWLIKNDMKFNITVEANEENIFIMIEKMDSISKKVIHNIISKNLPEAIFLLDNGILSFKLIKIKQEDMPSITINDETKNILTKTHYDNPTAVEFVENTAISIMPKIESLENKENELTDLIINFENHISKENLDLICEKFNEYVEVIDLLVEFEHLAFAIKTLVEYLKTLDESKLNTEKTKDFVSMLLNLVNDLTAWRENIFIKQEAIDIHYLDASLLSSCLQLQAIFDDAQVDEGDDLEFF
jgi:two-component system chemotaxis response regulator CheY